MAVTIVTPDEYTECSADISALVAIQVSSASATPGAYVEFIAAAAKPADTDRGLMVRTGETVLENNIAVVGASDKLWGKSSEHNVEVFVK